jgi:hypothetical protein
MAAIRLNNGMNRISFYEAALQSSDLWKVIHLSGESRPEDMG